MANEHSMAETPQQTIARLAGELNAAREIIAGYEAAQKQKSDDELQIAEKMAFGLTRDQAVSVLRRQREHTRAELAAHQTKAAVTAADPLNTKIKPTVTATHK